MASETWEARVAAIGAHLRRLDAAEAACAADARGLAAPEAPAA
jgi:hypothetical protein